jgi:hypothetical protein
MAIGMQRSLEAAQALDGQHQRGAAAGTFADLAGRDVGKALVGAGFALGTLVIDCEFHGATSGEGGLVGLARLKILPKPVPFGKHNLHLLFRAKYPESKRKKAQQQGCLPETGRYDY